MAKTMREKFEERMKANLTEEWNLILAQFNDGQKHTAAEIASKCGLTVGEVSANLVCFRDHNSNLGSHKVQSEETIRRFAELDDNGNMTGVIIEKQGCLVWTINDNDKSTKGRR